MLLKLLGYGTLVTIAANEMLGNSMTDKKFDYMTPWKNGRINPNFMRIRIPGDITIAGVDVWKGQDISVFGTWESLVKGIVAAANGDFEYMVRSKASPIVSTLWDAFSGETFFGRDYGVEEFMRSMLPFSLSDIGREAIGNTAVNTTGLKSSPITDYELRNVTRVEVAQELYDKPYSDLNSAQKRKVNDDERVIEATLIAEEGAIERGRDFAEGIVLKRGQEEAIEMFKDTGQIGDGAYMQEGINAFDDAFLDGTIDLDEWLAFDQKYRNGLQVIRLKDRENREEFDFPESTDPVDVAIRKYFDLSPSDYYDSDWTAYYVDQDRLYAAAVKVGGQDTADYLTFTEERSIKVMQDNAWDILNAAPSKYVGLSEVESDNLDDFSSEVYETQQDLFDKAKMQVTVKNVAFVLSGSNEQLFTDWSALQSDRDAFMSPEYNEYIGDNMDLLKIFMPWLFDSASELRRLGIEVEDFEDAGGTPVPERFPSRDTEPRFPKRLSPRKQAEQDAERAAVQDFISGNYYSPGPATPGELTPSATPFMGGPGRSSQQPVRR